MKKKDLLSQISYVESLLNDFSFEALSSEEARQLKNSFENFKSHLTEKISGKEVLTSAKVASKQTASSQYREKRLEKNANTVAAQWVAHVSHEIRTPLNGIIGFTDILKEEDLNEKQLERVSAIESASYSLMEIINELLEFSKLSAGLETFESVHFNFYALIQDVTYLCNTLILQEKVKLEIAIDSNIPKVLVGDPAKLSQVLLNLLGNAIKFVEEGEIRLNTVLKTTNDSELLLEFVVADDGIGIAEEELPFIFDSYRQAGAHTGSKNGGTGLGLSIVQQIIINQGGDIAVSSHLGEGTTFQFTLPYSIGDESMLAKKNQDKDYLREGAKLVSGSEILVFEDNLLNQRLIKQRLKKWGCITYVTDDYLDGMRLLEKHQIDVVLMDLRMPKMNGFEIANHIRKHKDSVIRQIPIIALTADFTIRDKEKSALNGINDYVLKPYSPDELLLKLLKNKNNMKKENSTEEIILTQVDTSNNSDDFDLQSIFKDCMQDFDLLGELIRLYKQNAMEFIGAARIHLEQQNFKELEFALHKIKSGLAMMKTKSLHAIVSEMHTSCKTEKDIKHIKFLYQCFLEEYPKVEKQIDASLEQLKDNRTY